MSILRHVYDLLIGCMGEESKLYWNFTDHFADIKLPKDYNESLHRKPKTRQKLLTVDSNWDTLNKDNDSHQVYDHQQAIRQYETSFQFWSMFKFTGQSYLQVYYIFTHFKTSSSAVKGSINFVGIQVGCFWYITINNYLINIYVIAYIQISLPSRSAHKFLSVTKLLL